MTIASPMDPSNQQGRKRSSSDAELNDDDSASFLDDMLVEIWDDDLSPTDPPELIEGGESKGQIATDPPVTMKEAVDGGGGGGGGSGDNTTPRVVVVTPKITLKEVVVGYSGDDSKPRDVAATPKNTTKEVVTVDGCGDDSTPRDIAGMPKKNTLLPTPPPNLATAVTILIAIIVLLGVHISSTMFGMARNIDELHRKNNRMAVQLQIALGKMDVLSEQLSLQQEDFGGRVADEGMRTKSTNRYLFLNLSEQIRLQDVELKERLVEERKLTTDTLQHQLQVFANEFHVELKGRLADETKLAADTLQHQLQFLWNEFHVELKGRLADERKLAADTLQHQLQVLLNELHVELKDRLVVERKVTTDTLKHQLQVFANEFQPYMKPDLDETDDAATREKPGGHSGDEEESFQVSPQGNNTRHVGEATEASAPTRGNARWSLYRVDQDGLGRQALVEEGRVTSSMRRHRKRCDEPRRIRRNLISDEEKPNVEEFEEDETTDPESVPVVMIPVASETLVDDDIDDGARDAAAIHDRINHAQQPQVSHQYQENDVALQWSAMMGRKVAGSPEIKRKQRGIQKQFDDEFARLQQKQQQQVNSSSLEFDRHQEDIGMSQGHAMASGDSLSSFFDHWIKNWHSNKAVCERKYATINSGRNKNWRSNMVMCGSKPATNNHERNNTWRSTKVEDKPATTNTERTNWRSRKVEEKPATTNSGRNKNWRSNIVKSEMKPETTKYLNKNWRSTKVEEKPATTNNERTNWSSTRVEKKPATADNPKKKTFRSTKVETKTKNGKKNRKQKPEAENSNPCKSKQPKHGKRNRC